MIPIDSFPTKKLKGIEYKAGRVFPFGASIMYNGVNFSIYSKDATGCTLLLYHKGEEKPFVKIPFPDEFRIGDVFTMMVFDLDIDDFEYAYLMDGPFDEKKGQCFDKENPLLDPYAKAVSGRAVWGGEMHKYLDESDYTGLENILEEEMEEKTLKEKLRLKRQQGNRNTGFRGRVIMEDFDWEGDRLLNIPKKDLVIYEMHVRGFTRHESSGVKYKGTYAGICEKIPYLKELGVNCVELLPIFEFDELQNDFSVKGQKLYNYWGYSTVNFFSPKAGYAASGSLGMEVDELKYTIKTLHENGIEVILDVVFNHTAEGDEKGPVISYKGIDNRTYYLLTPDGHYYNFSGCGNTMNCNNAVVRSFIKDCLRYWVASYHIDGFRFDLASILTRNQEGAPMISPPILESLAYDAVLGRAKLIAEAWDAGGLYQVGSFPSWNRFSEWNGKYRDCIRKFIKGDADCAPELYNRIAGSEDMYPGKTPAVSINFITCHDGFTLRDLVSYNEKHNELNGEGNLDGANDNNSWNSGAEGETDDEEILNLRRRQMENLLTILFLSRGVPMLLSGDEMGHTQSGNNNAYCQDNETTWLNWKGLQTYNDFHNFVKNIISFRKAHPVLRSEDFFRGHNGTGYPELSFHSETPWQLDMKAPTHTFAFMYAEDHKKFRVKEDSYIYVMVNAHWEPHTFTLPIIPEGFTWHLVTESAGRSYPAGKEKDMGLPTEWTLGCRMTVVMIGKKRG